jgi:hypothetical protein
MHRWFATPFPNHYPIIFLNSFYTIVQTRFVIKNFFFVVLVILKQIFILKSIKIKYIKSYICKLTLDLANVKYLNFRVEQKMDRDTVNVA